MPSRIWVACVLIACACHEHTTGTGTPAKDPVDQPDHAPPTPPPATATATTPATPPVPPTTATPSGSMKTVKVSMFGGVSIADGAIAVMDGGIHGVQGHTLVIPASGNATWERRLDGMQPIGKAGSGQLALTADEATRWHAWADELWKLAPTGKAAFDAPISNGPPRWVWAIVLRRGDEVRVLSGGAIASPTGAPEPAKSVLEWLVARVDAASAAAP
jgi:hypothetical protein